MSETLAPTIGRIVHYYEDEGPVGHQTMTGPIAAIVTNVFAAADGSERVDLQLFFPGGMAVRTGVGHASGDAPTHRCWNWPPRG